MNKIWLIVVVTLFAASAAVQAPERTLPPAKDKISLHSDYWRSLRISHYRYALQISCLCGFTLQPYTVEVRDGKLVSAVDGTGQPLSPLDFNAPPHPVGWFCGLSSIQPCSITPAKPRGGPRRSTSSTMPGTAFAA